MFSNLSYMYILLGVWEARTLLEVSSLSFTRFNTIFFFALLKLIYFLPIAFDVDSKCINTAVGCRNLYSEET